MRGYVSMREIGKGKFVKFWSVSCISTSLLAAQTTASGHHFVFKVEDLSGFEARFELSEKIISLYLIAAFSEIFSNLEPLENKKEIKNKNSKALKLH